MCYPTERPSEPPLPQTGELLVSQRLPRAGRLLNIVVPPRPQRIEHQSQSEYCQSEEGPIEHHQSCNRHWNNPIELVEEIYDHLPSITVLEK